jgi:pimeloyl-ACP methyl ester carboxylesterase/tetratricopeptide (TPR) repeat protein
MADSTNIKLRIPGTKEDAASSKDAEITTKTVRRYRVQSGRAAEGTVTIDVSPDEVIEIEFADGTRLWTSAERLTAEILSKSAKRDADGVIDMPVELSADTASRGWFGKLVIKTLTFFGIDIPEKAAKAIANRWEESSLTLDSKDKSELFRAPLLPDGGEFKLDPVTIGKIPADRTHLLFLHGTASSTGGSFGGLWTSEALSLREQLHQLYRERVLAFEHRSLTKSPIDNALRLAEKLPAGARLHIVSHSRGGLVGELIARASMSPAKAPFTNEELELWSELDPKEERGDLNRLNQLLSEKRFKVEKFVRVACPSRGTSLASGRLDIYLSVLFNLFGKLPFMKLPGINIAYDIFEELIKAIAKERADPDVLPGLEAMVPQSPLIKLVNHPNIAVDGALRVIAGDIEGSSVGSAIAALLTDPLYQRNHDLVVDTEAMFGGAKRSKGAAYVFHQGSDVSHFRYFKNDRSANHLVQALELDAIPDGFQRYEAEPTDETIVPALRSDGAARPTVFVLPGLMGSHLSADSHRVWLSLGSLALGGVKSLDIKAPGVAAEGVIRHYYGELIEFLGGTYDVVPFAYDWRRSIADAADQLAGQIERRLDEAGDDGLPIRLVAHSMGGLVARLMIKRRPDLWERMGKGAHPSRLIMLGTPNHGSHSVPFMLTGRDSLIKKLALLDLKNSKKELLSFVADYPGVLELLPNHGSMDLYAEKGWDELLGADGKGDADWRLPSVQDLDEARRIRDELDASPGDAERMCYVAGWARATPSDVGIEQDDDGAQRIVFKATSHGDGRVPWSSGMLKNVKTWYMPVAHGDLSRHEEGFPAILDLLEKGSTLVLSETPPEFRDLADQFEMTEERSPLYPTYNDLATSALGGGEGDVREKTATRIRVDIVHGNLAFASHPVMVGHYEGDTIVSAEASLDRALGGPLFRRLRLGRYPGAVGEAAVILSDDRKPKGAIIIGLGQVGTLSPGELVQSVSSGIRDYALVKTEQELRDSGEDGPPLFLKVTTLLIGTGAGGMQITDSVSAILRGVAHANDALGVLGKNRKPTIDRVEIVELYEDRAIQAAQALRKLKDDPQFRDSIISDRGFRIQSRRGGRTRAAFFEAEGWWQRLQITEDDKNRLQFKLLTNRARAEMHTQPTQRRLVDSFIDKVVTNPRSDPAVGVTLYEMLVPLDLKNYAPEQRDLVLVMDKAAARYPWELMRPQAARGQESTDGSRPPAVVEFGMVRQLQQDDFRTDVVNAKSKLALVIGDPKSKLADLPFAQAEAEAVAKRINSAGYDARKLIAGDATAEAIMTELHAREYRILHLAGHGIYREGKDSESDNPWFDNIPEGVTAGMVIGDYLYLTPAEVKQMRAVPEIVFINCCHIGNMKEADEQVSNNPPRLAANLATEFINMGVRAVIAAGWAIDDRLAETFASTFYGSLLAGDIFGDAVKKARQAAFKAAPTSNTWGAYQCYGDPAFTLTTAARGESRLPSVSDFVSVKELIVELDNKASVAQTATESKLERTRREMEALEQGLPADWANDPELQAGFGKVFGELGDFEKATKHYKTAISGEAASVALKAVEQLSNLEARQATSLPTSESKQAFKLLDEAEKRIRELISLTAKTSERLSLLGSISKRRMKFLTTDKERQERLDLIIKRYEDASASLKQNNDHPANPYPLINEVAATILKRLIKRASSGKGDLMSKLAKAKEDAARRDEIDPNYWDAVAKAECLLLEKLATRKITPEDEQEIIDALRNAKRRDGSPREERSVREQLAFIHSVLDEPSAGPERKGLAQAVGRIRSDLEA